MSYSAVKIITHIKNKKGTTFLWNIRYKKTENVRNYRNVCYFILFDYRFSLATNTLTFLIEKNKTKTNDTLNNNTGQSRLGQHSQENYYCYPLFNWIIVVNATLFYTFFVRFIAFSTYCLNCIKAIKKYYPAIKSIRKNEINYDSCIFSAAALSTGLRQKLCIYLQKFHIIYRF